MTSGGWRTVRVFISSTFRDMHAARDRLVKVVFPVLRERLERYRVYLIDIDLRWGVTCEQTENDQVLDLCLDQIDECRPFFLGLLGERYGWVPTHYPAHALKRFGWIQHYTGKSVTELEIVHGVLQNPQMRGHAFFYFRDPNCLQAVPEARRSIYAETDPVLVEKLTKLKERIRNSGHPVMESYPARWEAETFERPTNANGRLVVLDEFDQRVQQQLWDAIRAELELEEAPAMATADPLAEEADYHERFMESRLRVYVGREVVQRELLRYAQGAAEVSCLVTGPAGSGKSAALARFVTRFRQQHPDTFVLPHFVGASSRSTGLRDLLRRVCLSLKSQFALPDEVPGEAAKLIVSFRGMIGNIPAERRALLVLDALNELDAADRAQHLDWLPAKLPSHVKVVVSCISDAEETEPVLKAFQHRAHQSVVVTPLEDGERRAIIREVPSLSAKTLDEMQTGLLLSNPGTENPLFLLVALEELRGFGSFEEIDLRIAEFPPPSEQEPRGRRWLRESTATVQAIADERIRREQLTRLEKIAVRLEGILPVGDPLTALFLQVIERLEGDFDRQSAQTVLLLLASARRGLSERELQELIAGNSDLFPILRQLRPYLLSRGGLLGFYHRNLLKAVRERFLNTVARQSAGHALLAAYFQKQDYFLESPGEQRVRATRLPPTPRPTHGRKVDELAWQLLNVARLSGKDDWQSPHWDAVADLFTDLSFLEAKAEAGGMIFEPVRDFADVLTAMPRGHTRRRILMLLDEAVRRDAHFIARHPTTLFQCLWNTCWWYDCPDAAKHYNLQGRNPNSDAFPWRESGPQVFQLLESWRAKKETELEHFVWARSLRPPRTPLGAGQHIVLGGHAKEISSVAISPDGRWLASASEGRSIQVWDSESGAPRAVLDGHATGINCVCFSAREPLVIFASSDGVVRFWDFQANVETRSLSLDTNYCGRREVHGLAVSADGASLALAVDTRVIVWDVVRGTRRLCFTGHQQEWSLAGKDLSFVPPEAVRTDWQAGVFGVAFSPDGKQILSAGGADYHDLILWDTDTGTEIRRYTGRERLTIRCVAFSADGRFIASGNDDGKIDVWETESSKALFRFSGHEGIVQCMAFSPDGKYFAWGTDDGTVHVWQTDTGKESVCFRGHELRVTCLSFFPDGRQVASGSADRTVRIWRHTEQHESPSLHKHRHDLFSTAFSPDGGHVVSASWSKEVRIWSARDGTPTATIRTGQDMPGCLDSAKHRIPDYGTEFAALQSDGEPIRFCFGYHSDGKWRGLIARGHMSGAQQPASEFDGGVPGVSFSRDGRQLASITDDGNVAVWEIPGGVRASSVPDGRAEYEKVWFDSTSIAISPDGGLVAIANRSEITVWDATIDLKLLWKQPVRSIHKALAITFSPDREFVLWWGLSDNRFPHPFILCAKTGVPFPMDNGLAWMKFLTGGRWRSLLNMLLGRCYYSSSRHAVCWIKTRLPVHAPLLATDIRALLDWKATIIERRWKSVVTGVETEIQSVAEQHPIGWLPAVPSLLAGNSDGVTWSGCVGDYLLLFKLEGA